MFLDIIPNRTKPLAEWSLWNRYYFCSFMWPLVCNKTCMTFLSCWLWWWKKWWAHKFIFALSLCFLLQPWACMQIPFFPVERLFSKDFDFSERSNVKKDWKFSENNCLCFRFAGCWRKLYHPYWPQNCFLYVFHWLCIDVFCNSERCNVLFLLDAI